jgi:hypothetical protein
VLYQGSIHRCSVASRYSLSHSYTSMGGQLPSSRCRSRLKLPLLLIVAQTESVQAYCSDLFVSTYLPALADATCLSPDASNVLATTRV